MKPNDLVARCPIYSCNCEIFLCHVRPEVHAFILAGEKAQERGEKWDNLKSWAIEQLRGIEHLDGALPIFYKNLLKQIARIESIPSAPVVKAPPVTGLDKEALRQRLHDLHSIYGIYSKTNCTVRGVLTELEEMMDSHSFDLPATPLEPVGHSDPMDSGETQGWGKCPMCGDTKFQRTEWGTYCVGKGNCGFLSENNLAPAEPPKEKCRECIGVGGLWVQIKNGSLEWKSCERCVGTGKAPKPTVCPKCRGYFGGSIHYLACEYVEPSSNVEREGK